MTDPVNHPAHYNNHPSGVECITITQHFNFCLGNAIKYIWRADLKGNAIEDLEKAKWYIEQEIKRRKHESSSDKLNIWGDLITPNEARAEETKALQEYRAKGE